MLMGRVRRQFEDEEAIAAIHEAWTGGSRLNRAQIKLSLELIAGGDVDPDEVAVGDPVA